jgi:hypothetical protein
MGLPRVGDIVAIKNSSAYGLTASPLLFWGPETPPEIPVRHGTAEVIRESKDITEFNQSDGLRAVSFGCNVFEPGIMAKIIAG